MVAVVNVLVALLAMIAGDVIIAVIITVIVICTFSSSSFGNCSRNNWSGRRILNNSNDIVLLLSYNRDTYSTDVAPEYNHNAIII